jgi:hypothetical protein
MQTLGLRYERATKEIKDKHSVILFSRQEFEWFKIAIQMYCRESPIDIDRWKLKKLDEKIFGNKEK